MEHGTIVKEVKTKNYTVSLLKFSDDDYDIYIEHLGYRGLTGKLQHLNNALAAFDDVLVQVQGN